MIESINWLINLFTWQKTMKPENPNTSSNLKQINAEFDSFLTKLRVKIPNLQPGTVLKNPELEKKRLAKEISEKEIIANKILKEMIYWAYQKQSQREINKSQKEQISDIKKALFLALHPDKLNHSVSENAQYLKNSLSYEENKSFYFDKMRIKCEDLEKNPNSGGSMYQHNFPYGPEFVTLEELNTYKSELRARQWARAREWEELQRQPQHVKHNRTGAQIREDLHNCFAYQCEEQEIAERVEREKKWRAREQGIRDRPFEAYYNKQKEKKAGRSFLQNYAEDVAFAWHVLNTEFLGYLCLGVIITIAVLLLILISTIAEIGLTLSLGMVVANAGEIAISSLVNFAIFFPIALPGLLATSWTAKQEGPPNQGFLDGYAFLIKLILLAPIAFVCFLFAEKSDLKSPKSPKNSRNIKKARKAKNVTPPTFAPESKSEKLSPDLSSQGSPSELDNALPEAEVSSPRASVSPGYSNGADDCD